MKCALQNIEPFNIPPVDNQEAALFLRHLKPNDTFELNSHISPKCLMLYDVKYAFPRHCYGHAWLLSCSLDTFMDECENGGHASMEPILKKYVNGRIEIEYGGNMDGVEIRATPVNLR